VESGPFTSLEQAMLPSAAGERDVTRLFSLQHHWQRWPGRSVRWLPAGLTFSSTLTRNDCCSHTSSLPSRVCFWRWGCRTPLSRPRVRHPLSRSRGVVRRLAGLFALDSFGGGFVTQAFIAYWFTETYGTSPRCWGRVLRNRHPASVVVPVAVRLAGRVGLVNTMVFTHLPSTFFWR
jgi:hypothetical protein